MKPYDKQIGGSHYQNFKIQPSKFVIENELLYPEGCVIKYILRHRLKGKKEDLKKDHGLLIEGDWQQLSFEEDSKNYIKRILKSGDVLSTDSRIELSTIHGAKGRERENIVLCMDYGTETQSEMLSQKALDDPDSTHRLFFVGVTRAMQRLYILAPLTSHYYTIGEPIV